MFVETSAVILFGKIFCLFIGIMYTGSIIVNAFYKSSISGAVFFLMALGWTGFITLMWLI